MQSIVPLLAVNEPAAQAMHAATPGALLYVPGPHNEQND